VLPFVLFSLLTQAEIRPSDTVLEIGPGTGNLTVKLLEKARKVIAVEVDPRMVVELRKRVQDTEYARKLEIINGDFLKTQLPPFDLCVANCPYNISSGIVFKLLSLRPAPRRSVLMFQREFAMRLCARPGQELYSRISINTQLLARVEHIIKVSRNSFRPPPKVDSSVVVLYPHLPPPEVNFTEWDGLVHIAFNRKNKTLGALFRQKSVLEVIERNLRTAAAVAGTPFEASGDEVKTRVLGVLDAAGMADERAGKLDIDDMLRLLQAFIRAGIRFA
jgi:18S rRNA (adenine1779-N6/adenine1780-N6)-dimethyltransferase